MKKYFVLLLFLTFLTSCEKNDDSTPLPNDLNGIWILQSVSCFCFFPVDYDYSAHQLDFNNAEAVMTVTNPEENTFITSSGPHPIRTEDNKIIISDGIAYIYEVKGDTLTMLFVDNPELADDEIMLTYKKMN